MSQQQERGGKLRVNQIRTVQISITDADSTRVVDNTADLVVWGAKKQREGAKERIVHNSSLMEQSRW